MIYTQVGQRVEVGGLEFTPPEELPAASAQQGVSGQNLWIMRLGEVVQRRVSQAGAMMTPILESRHAATPPARQSRLFTPEAEHAMAQRARRAPHLHSPELPARQPAVASSSGSLSQEQVLAAASRGETTSPEGDEIARRAEPSFGARESTVEADVAEDFGGDECIWTGKSGRR